MITGKIDVSKIDKAKLFKGAKGTYLDIVLIDTPGGKYGDYMIVQGVSKEERDAGVRGAILGNANNRAGGQGKSGGRYSQRQSPSAGRKPTDDDSDLEPPF